MPAQWRPYTPAEVLCLPPGMSASTWTPLRLCHDTPGAWADPQKVQLRVHHPRQAARGDRGPRRARRRTGGRGGSAHQVGDGEHVGRPGVADDEHARVLHVVHAAAERGDEVAHRHELAVQVALQLVRRRARLPARRARVSRRLCSRGVCAPLGRGARRALRLLPAPRLCRGGALPRKTVLKPARCPGLGCLASALLASEWHHMGCLLQIGLGVGLHIGERTATYSGALACSVSVDGKPACSVATRRSRCSRIWCMRRNSASRAASRLSRCSLVYAVAACARARRPRLSTPAAWARAEPGLFSA